jgi:fumarate reductase flavoprotein subunit
MDSPCFDLVIVGGGLAGLAAGLRASELGLRAVVLEKGAEPGYLCNSRMSGGVIHAAYRQVMRPEQDLCQAIDKATGGYSNPQQVQAVARDGRKLVRWLQSHGVQFLTASGYEYHKWTLAPPPQNRPGLQWPGRGGDVMVRRVSARLLALGGQIHLGTRARRLRMQGGRCIGLDATGPDGRTLSYQAQAVVLADGGFQGNVDLMRRYISPEPAALKQRGAGTGVGDGLTMALDVGAAVVHPQAFYGHVLSRDAMHSDRLWPYPMIDTIASSGIVVDEAGLRFVDEGLGGVWIANAIARLRHPLSSVALFDHATWSGPATQRLVPPNPNLVSGGGTIFCQPTLAQLCARAQLPPAAQATVQDYNAALRAGRMPAGQPPRTASPYPALPIERAPFYAIPLCAGITYTMGGIHIDGQARVLREDGSAVPGLYAAGATTGGLEGGPQAGYVGGLLKAGVMGLRAAQDIAERQALGAAAAEQPVAA